MKTWALLDDGSDVSLFEQSLADDLDINEKMKPFSLTTVNSPGVHRKGMEANIMVKAITEGEEIEISKAWTVDRLPVSDRSIPQKEDINTWPHLKGIALHTANKADIKLLIGCDTPEAFWVLEERRGRRKEPYAIRTPLGWTLMGPTSKRNDEPFQVNNIQMDETLHSQVRRFWELDHHIEDCKEGFGHSIEDKRAISIMDDTTRLVEGHYQMELPWRHSPPTLPDNRKYAQTRLKHLERRLQRDKALHEQYKKTMGVYIQRGYAKEVDNNQKNTQAPVWYLPHHPVTHPMKPDKVRVVFDCAAKYKGTSLNSQLLQGPDFTNKLVGVLIRFRQEAVAIAADIEGMFHQVKVSPKDVML
ncbi:hypothetical protein BSL78_19599 [Apostichopus japonicus]|uniref:Peptidase aspartic putative domain-containing protein n=1 Tax=Stichopus japonicus TaxID=307972 RepID=A0A2G8K689_STIJA|nr:hypothetical protein BSL78_19599 [Apostichopus japonicus]